MKKLCALVFLTGILAYSVAAVVFFVQSNGDIVFGGTTKSIPVNPTIAGNTGVVCVAGFDTTATFSVTATGATFSSVETATNNSAPSPVKAQIFVAQNLPAGIVQVTGNSTTSQQFGVIFAEYSGLLTAGVVDQHTSGTGVSNSPSAGPVTTTTNDAVLVGCMGAWNPLSITESGLFVNRQHPNTQLLYEDRIVATIGAYSVTALLGSSQPWAMAFATFKGIVGPPPPPPPPPVPQWPVGYPSMDQFGGMTNLPANDGLSGWRFHKYVNRTLLVDPAGNGFFSFGVWNVANTGTWENQKYGSDSIWGQNTVKRLQSWGFNTLWDHTYNSVRPDTSNPNKMVASWFQDGASYPARNVFNYCLQGAKLISNGINQSFYTGYLAPMTDPYDPCFTTWHNKYFAPATAQADLVNAMANQYITGWSSAESDFMWCFGPGPDFATVPPGHDVAHCSWLVLATAPTQASGVVNGVTMPYADQTVYGKAAFVTFLQGRYATIGALNTAWASTYTTFGTAGGWGVGTGLLDEDGRHVWMGSFANLAGETPTMKTDLNAFMFQYASKFFSVQRTALKTNYPNKIYFGPNILGGWGTPPQIQIIQAAALYLDAIQTNIGTGAVDDQARLDFLMQYLGDKPVLQWMGFPANADSAICGSLNTCTNPPTYLTAPTQVARGVNYNSIYNFFANYTVGPAVPGGAANQKPIVAVRWWAWQDSTGEKTNWGLVTFDKGNAYNGVESVTGAVIDQQGFPAGGEAKNYGNFIGPGTNTVINTNTVIMSALAGVPIPANPVLSVASVNPASSVVIVVTPLDLNTQGNGTTPFNRTYTLNQSVSLTAPATASGNNFSGWTGCTTPSGQTCTQILTANATVTANYQTPPPTVWTITINSTNPTSGVVVANAPADNAVQTSTMTPGSLFFNDATSFVLTAPLTVGSNTFSNFTNCANPSSNVCTEVATVNKTITVNYTNVPVTRALTVTSVNPIGTAIPVAPNCGVLATITTPTNCTYTLGTSVTLTAPATSGGNDFGSWTGCDTVVVRACTVAVNGNQPVTVTYLTPVVNGVLSVASTNPASGVSITSVAPVCDGLATIVTPKNCTYGVPTSVSLIAPATAGGNAFLAWSGCDSVGGPGNRTCTINVTTNMTIVAKYAFTLTVNSTNPSTGTVISFSPFSVNGSGSVTTPGTLLFTPGVNITFTAPPTLGSSVFSSWSGCTSVLNLTCTIVINTNTTITANYIGVGTFTCSSFSGKVNVSGKVVITCKP